MDPWADLVAAIEPARQQVVTHPIYQAIDDLPALRVFMEHHVWAVWDFMSLLTRLQRDLTCVTVPWLPRLVDPAAQRFVNEIKLGEESDADPDAPSWTSHLDLYLRAMAEVGADTDPITLTLQCLASGDHRSVPVVAGTCGAPPPAVEFITGTFRTVNDAPLVAVAAAFALGREQLIPDLFRPLLDAHSTGRLLTVYLERHIELDNEEHGPLAHRLVQTLAANSPAAWVMARTAAADAIDARRHLWDGTVAAITRSRATTL